MSAPQVKKIQFFCWKCPDCTGDVSIMPGKLKCYNYYVLQLQVIL